MLVEVLTPLRFFALSAGAVSFGQIVKALAMRIAGQLVQFQFSQELSKII